jgi:hypothetical protein
MNQASEKEAHAHDKQEVGQDRTQHRRLHDLDLTVLERNNTDLSMVSIDAEKKRQD